MRIRHVIPTVGPSASAGLREAQELTLRSVRTALHCTEEGIDVEVRAVHFPDEPLDCDWVTDCPILDRSVLDITEFEVPRRLPLLFDVLAGLGDSSQYDVAVFTNADIAVQPLFYELIAELHDDGHDAASVTRRTVHPRFRGSSMARLMTADSSPHPGHDCFSMTADIVDRLETSNVALGTRWVARSLLWQLQLTAKKFRHFGDLHATLHVGDDRPWVDPQFAEYERHNAAATKELVRALVERYGTSPVERLQSIQPFLAAIATDSPVNARRADARPRPYGSPAFAGLEPRMIFSANPGRSGSAFLASLLGASPSISSGHEREPKMVGPWARRIAFEPASASYDERLIKADAVRAELAQIPSHWAYADSSHMFIKTFADVIFDEFQHERLNVVVLRRDPIDVARSMFNLDYLGPLPAAWEDWLLPPTAPESAFPLDPEDIVDQFDLIFGYLVDIENRTDRFRTLAPAVTWIDAWLEHLASRDGALQLFERLDVPTPDDLDDILADQPNRKTQRKSHLGQPVPRSLVQKRLTRFLDRHRDRPDLQLFIENNGLDGL